MLLSKDTGNNVNTGNTRIYSYNTPCPPEMDPTVWEVKWEHRDDCVAALAVRSRSLIVVRLLKSEI